MNWKLIFVGNKSICIRQVGRVRKFSGPVMAMWVEALNFLEFFVSFLGQAKNEKVSTRSEFQQTKVV